MITPDGEVIRIGYAQQNGHRYVALGTLIEHGGFRMFFTGDGEFEANDRWRMSFASLSQSVDVLKVGSAAKKPGGGGSRRQRNQRLWHINT